MKDSRGGFGKMKDIGSGIMMEKRAYALLDEEEDRRVWDLFYAMFDFRPSIKPGTRTFTVQQPHHIYDISAVEEREIDRMAELIPAVFAECLEKEGFLYALDWQHSSFRYNPRVKIVESSLWIENPQYQNGGYHAYFPSFYPDGDYYLFLEKNFKWGYLGHPWQQKVWVFGERLMEKMENISKEIGFKRIF